MFEANIGGDNVAARRGRGKGKGMKPTESTKKRGRGRGKGRVTTDANHDLGYVLL